MNRYSIVPYDNHRHREQVIALWNEVFGYETAHNQPSLVIDKKLEVDGMFFVAESESVVGTVMCGYDGHRGWIYSLAVLPSHRRQGIGQSLVRHAEQTLVEKGCTKVNLQILASNKEVEKFYRKLGFKSEKRISMGKCLFTRG